MELEIRALVYTGVELGATVLLYRAVELEVAALF